MKHYNTPSKGSYDYLPFSESLVVSSNKAIIRLVGCNIERLRKESGLSYAKVAKRTGCCEGTVYCICKGTIDFCGISILSKLCLSFGYTLEEVLFRPITSDFNAFGVKK